MCMRGKFIAWFNNEFQKDPLWVAMETCVEASPWHRENSVATHTRMVVSEYISWVDKHWTTETLIGALAAAFHDTGKPLARVEKYKPERGNYNSFGGHEIISARLWEDYAMRNYEGISQLFDEIPNQFCFMVGFIIEHHMPYDISADKIRDIACTAASYFRTPVFQNHLTADTHGRIADDHHDKINKVDVWITSFETKLNTKVLLSDNFIRDKKTLIMPIGPSGCGKSTYLTVLRQYWGDTISHYSWDLLRLAWYSPDYNLAYQMSTEDPQFANKATKEFNKLVLTGNTIYVDNTNLSRKRRRAFIQEARNRGYNTIAVVFPIALNTLIERQEARGKVGEKIVPREAVKQQYMSLQGPLLGEFDQIEVIDTRS